MGGLIRAFVMFSVAGLGWTMGRNAGEKLWTQVQEKYPGTIEQAKKAVADLLEPLKKGKPGEKSAPAGEGAEQAPPSEDAPRPDSASE